MAGGFVPHGERGGKLWNILERGGEFVLRPAKEETPRRRKERREEGG
jgi:hypothetical protein